MQPAESVELPMPEGARRQDGERRFRTGQRDGSGQAEIAVIQLAGKAGVRGAQILRDDMQMMGGGRADQRPRHRRGQHRAQRLASAQPDRSQQVPRLAAYRLSDHAAFPKPKLCGAPPFSATPHFADSVKQLPGDSQSGRGLAGRRWG